MRIIAVSGMIGAGKTTFCDALSKSTGWKVVREDVRQNPFLPLFYKQMDRWAVASQITFMLNKTEIFEEAIKDEPETLIVDRTLQEDFFVFCAVLKKYNIISKEEHALLEKIYTLLVPRWLPPDMYIYAEDTDENCFGRILNRGDAFESKIEIGYVKSVGDAYRSWKAKHLPAPDLQVYPEIMDFRKKETIDSILIDIQRHLSGLHSFKLPG